MHTALIALFLALNPHQPLDTDSDGFPDLAELKTNADRRNFRRWFTTIALSRYLNPTDEVADCTNLVLFSYREALKAHNANWRKSFGNLVERTIPEIEAFHYPEIPYIGTDIFRVADGSYQTGDRKRGKLNNFADVRHLMEHHTVFLSRKLDEKIKSGDLLFFTPKGKEAHVMIYIELRSRPYLLYHTGPGIDEANGEVKEGEMRLIKFETLLALDNEIWRPVETNPAFAGFYRFKILI